MKKRDNNIDLFRIIATLLVALLHVLGKGGILDNASPSSATYWTAWFLEICAFCAVNCFALISGYIMVNKNIRLKNIFNMWFQVLFYSLLFTVLFFVFVPETRTLKNLVTSVLPIVGKRWWYVSSYFALFFFIPFLNKAVDNISKQTYQKFIIIVLIGICCLGTLIPMDAFLFKNGYSAIWLMVLYLFGAYIRKYGLGQAITPLKSMLAFWTMVILTFISKIGISFLTKRLFGEVKLENILISYTSITIVLSSVFLLLFCLKIKINPIVSKVISFFSPATLGVYLIHVHPLVFDYIIGDAFISLAHKPAIIMILYAVVGALLIFVVCSIIDLLRIQFFKLIRLSSLCEVLEKKMNSLYLFISKYLMASEN